jgi:hypothetical protein
VRIVQHLRDHGSYKPQIQNRGVQRPRRVANMEEGILSSVEDQPVPVLENLDVSIIFCLANIKDATIRYIRTMCKKFSVCNVCRQEFCEWILAQDNAESNFLDRIG